jgi:hypothetical protein
MQSAAKMYKRGAFQIAADREMIHNKKQKEYTAGYPKYTR